MKSKDRSKQKLRKITDNNISIGDKSFRSFQKTGDYSKGWLAVHAYRTAIKAIIVESTKN